MLRRAILAVLLAAAAAAPASAQRLTVRTFTAEDGLPDDRVKCIVRDSRGLLWFCTTAGIAWFDGRRFNAFGTPDGLPHPSINDIAEDPEGGYWIATNGGGLARLDRSPGHIASWPPDAGAAPPRMTAVRVGTTPRSNRVNAVHVDRAGRIWAGTDAGLFMRADAGAFEEVALPIPRRAPYVLVWRFSESEDGTLWMATTQGLVSRAANGSITRHAVQPDESADHVRTVLDDGEGGVWIGHDSGLYRARRPARSASPGGAIAALELEHVPLEHVKGVPVSMHRAQNGATWIGFSRGSLVVFDGRRFETLTGAEGLPTDIRAIGADAEDRLWAGGPTGATRIHTNGPAWFDLPTAFEGRAVTDLVETLDGTIAAITAGSEIDIHWSDGRRLHTVRPTLPAGRVREGRPGNSLAGRGGTWWFGTRDGLLRFDAVAHVRQLDGARPSRVYGAADGLPGEDVHHLFEDSRGTIWVTTATPQGYATARFDSTRRRFERVDGLPQDRQVSNVIEDRRGNVWFAFRDGGVARWRRGRVQVFEAEGLLADWVGPMFCDRRGHLWLTSGGRILRVVNPDDETPAFETYSSETRTAAGNHFFAEDPRGVLSVSGSDGINRLIPNPAQVLPAPDAEGLRGLTVARMDRAGFLWLATRRGIARVDLSRPQAPPAARVLVHHLTIGGREYPLAVGGQRDVAEIAVPLHASPIDIQYWSPAAGARLQHRLVGADSTWRQAGAEHTVSLAHLSAGRYTFEVRAIDASGTPLPDPATVRLYVVPPLWQRGWVLVSAAAAIAVLAWVAHRRRVARAIEVERLRTRIATDLHDDIGSNLSRIAILSELAQRRERGEPDDSRDVLATIGRSARELVDSMGDIVWAIRPERDGPADLAQRMRRFASDVLAPRQIALTFEAPEADKHLMLPPDVRREVFLVFKEAIHNVLKHAGATQVDVTLRVSGGEITLTVSDNGRGFAGEDAGAAGGYGLTSLRGRAARIGGVLEVVSLPAHGTSVRLRAPAPVRAHLFG